MDDNQTTRGAQLPPFYKQLVALDRNEHAGLRLRQEQDFRFAADANAIVLAVAEFQAAAQSYPILFTTGERPMPVALVGLKRNQNLFLDAAGKWRAGAYVPAYLRRYPFILVAPQGNAEHKLLAVDPTADRFGDAGAALFEDGKPTQVTEDALKLAGALDEQFQQTNAFAAALRERDLLVPTRATVSLKNGERIDFTDFQVIDGGRFDKLDDATVLDWRKRGWLAAAYAHLYSAGRWAALIDLAAAAAAQGEGADAAS